MEELETDIQHAKRGMTTVNDSTRKRPERYSEVFPAFVIFY
ncbi:hypothetical protein [Photobacterium lutimaris]|nr:hypothetical protein [Photobacterium lutimaris]